MSSELPGAGSGSFSAGMDTRAGEGATPRPVWSPSAVSFCKHSRGGEDAQGRPRPPPSQVVGWDRQQQGLQLFCPTGVHGEGHASLRPLYVQHASAVHTFIHLLVCTFYSWCTCHHAPGPLGRRWGPAPLPFLLHSLVQPVLWLSLSLTPSYLDTLSTHHPSVHVYVYSHVHMCVLL